MSDFNLNFIDQNCFNEHAYWAFFSHIRIIIWCIPDIWPQQNAVIYAPKAMFFPYTLRMRYNYFWESTYQINQIYNSIAVGQFAENRGL